MEAKYLVLKTGEKLITRITSEDDVYLELEYPFQVQPVYDPKEKQIRPEIMPWLLGAGKQKIKLKREYIMIETKPVINLEKIYMDATSPLILPPGDKVIDPKKIIKIK